MTATIEFKGQSAIEYLMTYGWMLLVVAIVGGAIFSIVQSEGIESSSGFTGSDFAVEDFGLSQSNSLDMVLRNTASNRVHIDQIVLTQGDEQFVNDIGENMGVSDSISVSTLGVIESSSANSVDVEIKYDSGNLEGLTTSGTVSGNLAVNPEEAAPDDNWAYVDVSNVPDETLNTEDMGDFYIMKYQASREDATDEDRGTVDVPTSSEETAIWTSLSQTDAIEACEENGYDLQSNEQWQAATMAEIGNEDTWPLGNNDNGASYEDGSSGTPDPENGDIVLTGSGPESWANDLGIYDLNGNVWELTSTVANTGDPFHFEDNNNVETWNSNGYPEEIGESEEESLNNGFYWGDSETSQAVVRGGRYSNQELSGMFTMGIFDDTEQARPYFGFRCTLG